MYPRDWSDIVPASSIGISPLGGGSMGLPHICPGIRYTQGGWRVTVLYGEYIEPEYAQSDTGDHRIGNAPVSIQALQKPLDSTLVHSITDSQHMCIQGNLGVYRVLTGYPRYD